MPVAVECRDDLPHPVDVDALIDDAQRMLAAMGVDAELSVVVTDSAEMRALNGAHRGKDTTTDVLSFPQDGPDGPLLGDIVIDVETALRQGAERGHDLATELRVLLAHGVAHLLGHDHYEAAQAAAMGAVETRLLAALAWAGAVPAGLVETGWGRRR